MCAATALLLAATASVGVPALRGCHVYVIAPAAENAPSAGFPQLSRTREIWSRFSSGSDA